MLILCLLYHAKILFVASIVDTKKIGKDFTFCRFLNYMGVMKNSIPVLSWIHAEIVGHVATEIGRRRETKHVGYLNERETLVAQHA